MADAAWHFTHAPEPRRLDALSAVLVHFSLQIRRLLRFRVLGVWLFVSAAVVLGGFGLTRLSLSDPGVMVKWFGQFVLRAEGLTALGLATAAIRVDADAGVLGLFLLRPRAPTALPLGRWLAATVLTGALGLLLWLGTVLAVQGTVLLMPSAQLARMAWTTMLAAPAYCAIFLAFSCWFRNAAAVSLGWFTLADLLSPMGSDWLARFSPAHHLNLLVLGAYPSASGLSKMVKDLAQMPQNTVADPLTPWILPIESGWLLALTAVALVLAVVRLRREVPAGTN